MVGDSVKKTFGFRCHTSLSNTWPHAVPPMCSETRRNHRGGKDLVGISLRSHGVTPVLWFSIPAMQDGDCCCRPKCRPQHQACCKGFVRKPDARTVVAQCKRRQGRGPAAGGHDLRTHVIYRGRASGPWRSRLTGFLCFETKRSLVLGLEWSIQPLAAAGTAEHIFSQPCERGKGECSLTRLLNGLTIPTTYMECKQRLAG